MLTHSEPVETLSHWPRKQDAVGLIIPAVLAFFLVALSCTEVVARQANKPRFQELTVKERVEAEQLLWDLGYWAGPIDGKFDSASRHALIAFQKVEGRTRTGRLTTTELTALGAARRPTARDGSYFHVEIDLARQVLFVIDENGTVARILPVSTGNGELYMDHGKIHRAHTPTGTYKVQWKIDGWRLSSLGLLFYPSYIVNGIAIHGSTSIPVYPASHGCIRVPMFAARELSRLLSVGTGVVIYDSGHLSERSLESKEVGYQ